MCLYVFRWCRQQDDVGVNVAGAGDNGIACAELLAV